MKAMSCIMSSQQNYYYFIFVSFLHVDGHTMFFALENMIKCRDINGVRIGAKSKKEQGIGVVRVLVIHEMLLRFCKQIQWWLWLWVKVRKREKDAAKLKTCETSHWFQVRRLLYTHCYDIVAQIHINFANVETKLRANNEKTSGTK